MRLAFFHNTFPRAAIDDNLPLAAKLQSDRSELLGSSTHDNLANIAAAGVEDVVKLVLEQDSCLCCGAVDNAIRSRVQVLWQQPSD